MLDRCRTPAALAEAGAVGVRQATPGMVALAAPCLADQARRGRVVVVVAVAAVYIRLIRQTPAIIPTLLVEAVEALACSAKAVVEPVVGEILAAAVGLGGVLRQMSPRIILALLVVHMAVAAGAGGKYWKPQTLWTIAQVALVALGRFASSGVAGAAIRPTPGTSNAAGHPYRQDVPDAALGWRD